MKALCVTWCHKPSSGCDAYIDEEVYLSDPAPNDIVRVSMPPDGLWCAHVDRESSTEVDPSVVSAFEIVAASGCSGCQDS